MNIHDYSVFQNSNKTTRCAGGFCIWLCETLYTDSSLETWIKLAALLMFSPQRYRYYQTFCCCFNWLEPQYRAYETFSDIGQSIVCSTLKQYSAYTQ